MSSTINIAKREENILSFWQENDIFTKSLEKTKNAKPYIFYDGPPFATGLPHHGHLLASTIKDIIPRYQTMLGRHVERRFGWDCHGLPIENEIHKSLNLSPQEAVEKLGIAGYNEACRGIVMRYRNEWRDVIERLGRWVDFDNDYKTMDIDYMESVWWTFHQLWKRGLVYLGNKVVSYSTELGTPLANFEAGSNYQNIQDPAVTVRISLEESLSGHQADLLIWTTTPWTLPANLAVCVHPDETYIMAKTNTKPVIVAKALAEKVLGENINVLWEGPGNELSGMQYKPIFMENVSNDPNAYKILTDSYVTTTDGTGLVHNAPAFGEDDMRVCQANGINTLIIPIDSQGKFDQSIQSLSTKYIKDADKIIIKILKENNQLYDHTTIQHSYPFCPRTDTPLIQKAVPSWYIAVSEIRDKCISANDNINWVPSHIKHGRFGKWLEQARDWAVSRNRVWGTPLPIWINNVSGKMICMDSVAMLERHTGKRISDLHREHIDALDFNIPGEQGTYKRTTEVFDCWFESGAMPYAQLHYPFENSHVFEQGFPAEFIAEGLDQTRGWFYSLTVLSAALYESPAFKNVIVNGIILAKDGKKMSKRLKNYTDPMSLINQYGSDALRLYLIHSGLVKGEEQCFDDHMVGEMVRKTLLPWYNSLQFLTTYADIDAWQYNQHNTGTLTVLDRWILSKQSSLKHDIENAMTRYALYDVVPQLIHFIDELTNTYIRLNRKRFWGENMTPDKLAAYNTLFAVLMDLSKMMAPFTPFASEFVYQTLCVYQTNQPESVHLTGYPKPQQSKINKELEAGVAWMNRILILARQARNDAKIKVKTPLKTMTVIHNDKHVHAQLMPLCEILKSELNIKDIIMTTDEDAYVQVHALPNSPVLGKRFCKAFGKIRQAIVSLSPSEIRNLEQHGKIAIDGNEFSASDILVRRTTNDTHQAVTDGFISIELDTKLTEDLIHEGLAREVVNRVQKTRKDLDLNVSDRITISFNVEKMLHQVIEAHAAYIKHETLAENILFNDEVSEHHHEIDGHLMHIEIKTN